MSLLPPMKMLDGELEDTDSCKNHKRAKAWFAKKERECKGREKEPKCEKDLDAARVDEILRSNVAKGCPAGGRRRKTRARRGRKSRRRITRRR